MELRETSGNLFEQFRMVFQRAVQCLGNGFPSQIIVGGPQAAREEQHIRFSFHGGTDGLHDARLVVAHAERVGGEEAQLQQRFSQVRLVAVDNVAPEEFVSCEDHLGGPVHGTMIRHALCCSLRGKRQVEVGAWL